jgi:creatinine amidohydrolase
VYDILASLAGMGFKKIVLLDCHGHHSGILNVAVRRISDDFKIYPAIVSPAAFSRDVYAGIRKSKPGGSIHGGEWETSLMLYFGQPVNMNEAVKNDTMRYHSEFVPGDNFISGKGVFWSTWGIQRSKTGIYGDPTCADRKTGEKCCRAIVENLAKFLKEYARKK